MSTFMNVTNLDEGQTAFFYKQLNAIKARTYDIQYQNLKATSLFPVSSEVSTGALSITYEQFDQVGIAAIIADYAMDLPRCDVKGIEVTSPIRSLGSSYGYSLQEIRGAQMAGTNLVQRKANAARLAVEQGINRLAFFGSEEYGLTGLFNNPNVTRVAVPLNAGSTSTKWEDKTGDEILKDMHDAVNSIVETTNGVESPNTMLLPIKQFNQISTTRMTGNSDITIMEFFLNSSPFITDIQYVTEAKGAGVGVSPVLAGGDVMVVYDRNPDKLSLEIPQPFEQLAVEPRGLEFVIAVHARVASLLIFYPLSVSISEGI